jgi:DNA helicase-2/ATP-dependent DNA helicase PcrA
VELLLAERWRGASPDTGIELPAHLSASALVRLSADPQGFANSLRRPIPVEPSAQARRGTEFHAWVESHFAAPALVDVDDLPGMDDDLVAADIDLGGLRSMFLGSPWADRGPIAIEVDIETPVAGYLLRSRIDAVFPDLSAGRADGVVVVDWKTGRPPAGDDAARSRELQLAVYRLAWSRWAGVPLDRVRAAFFYVATGQTVYPERLLDEAEIAAFLNGAAVSSSAVPPRAVVSSSVPVTQWPTQTSATARGDD